jgi:hypothetical protein
MALMMAAPPDMSPFILPCQRPADRDAARIRHDPLTDERQRLLARRFALVLEDDETRRLRRASGDAQGAPMPEPFMSFSSSTS